MRQFVLATACSLLLALSACNQIDESYQVASPDAYAKLSGSGYAEGIYPLPPALAVENISVSFEAIPTDQTAYWKFTRDGKELGRVNAVVEGDAGSSTISYSYAKGPAASEDEKLATLVQQYMQPLIMEAVDSKIENRPFDQAMKTQADAMITVAAVGRVMNGARDAIDKAGREQEERATALDAEIAVHTASHTSTAPTTDLSAFDRPQR